MAAPPRPPDAGVTEVVRAGVPVHWIATVAPLGVDAFFTDRRGGVSAGSFGTLNVGDHVGDDPCAVTENRARVARAAGVAPGDLVFTRQVHGAAIECADTITPSEADGLVLTEPGRAAAVCVADCVPVLLVAPAAHTLAVVHAGWRGLTAGVLRSALAAVAAAPDELHAVIGPAVSPARYQVGPEVANHFADVPGAVTADVGDRARLDLVAVAAAQLRDGGVRSERIGTAPDVTDGGERYFSARAARPCGRFALVARWRP